MTGKGFQLDPNYNEVKNRIREFREKHPDGSFQPVNVDEPFRTFEFAGFSWVSVTMAAYRSPDDPKPGVGSAWQPVPGTTPYTKMSELMNAETSATGRAIVNALAADASASADEVRQARDNSTLADPPTVEQFQRLDDWFSRLGDLKKKDTEIARKLRDEVFAAIKVAGWRNRAELTQAKADRILTVLDGKEQEVALVEAGVDPSKTEPF